MFNGQECIIMWLGKTDVLRPLVHSYAKGLPPTLRENYCSLKHLFNYFELQWITHQCSQFFNACYCHFCYYCRWRRSCFCSSCYPPCCFSMLFLHGAFTMYVVTYTIPLPFFTVVTCYCHPWYSCYDIPYSCWWMHPCFALVTICPVILQSRSSMIHFSYSIVVTYIIALQIFAIVAC